MFSKLVASEGRTRRSWNSRTVLVSLIVHLFLFAGAVWATTQAPEGEQEPEEEVAFVEIEEQQPVAPEPPEPAPPPVAPPAAPPPPQGFQELVPPETPPALIPEVDPTQEVVTARDFSGIGVAGGRAQGVAGGVPSAEPMDSTPVFTVEETGVAPEIINKRELIRLLERNYPRTYADAGVAGQVVLKFLIETDGTVAPASITVISATNEAFADAARRAAERIRFRPIQYRGTAVRVWASMPITFQPLH